MNRSVVRVSFFLSALCVSLPFVAAADAVLYVSPERGTYAVGDFFDVQVLADTGDTAINAAEAEILFDPNELVVEDVSTYGSILSLWPTPPKFSNEEGTIRFSGWTNSKYAGTDGLLATITFRALRTTLSTARLTSGALLSADGKGSNIITAMRSGIYGIEPKQVIAALPEEEIVEEGQVLGASIDQPALPPAPALVEYPFGTVPLGERVIVRGTAIPDAAIHIWLARGDEPKVLTRVTSAADGSFTFVSDMDLETGVYRLWAQAVDASGVESEPSKRIKFDIRAEGAAAALASIAGVASALIPFLVLLFIAGFGAAYMLHRYRMDSVS